MNFDLQARADELRSQLEREIRHERLRAVGDYWAGVILMVAALASSVLAGLGGLAFNWTAKETGAVALIPGAIAIIATTLKLEGKSDWHYRKLYQLDALRSQLLCELPESPSVQDIAAISKERSTLIRDMDLVWEKSFPLSWNQFKSPALEIHAVRGKGSNRAGKKQDQ
jgi:hypothetical protein